jgi:hypothetical protein
MDSSLMNSTFPRDFTPAPMHYHVPFLLTGEALIGCDAESFNTTQDSNIKRAAYAGIAILSIFSSIIVATMIFYNPKLSIYDRFCF